MIICEATNILKLVASATHRELSAIALTFPRAEPPRAMHVRLPGTLECRTDVRLPRTPDARGGSPRPAENDLRIPWRRAGAGIRPISCEDIRDWSAEIPTHIRRNQAVHGRRHARGPRRPIRGNRPPLRAGARHVGTSERSELTSPHPRAFDYRDGWIARRFSSATRP